MRITGGTATSRTFKVPKGFDVRPTPDLVKQAIFNSLGEHVIGRRVLELFAGSGALGFECLSRGASSVIGVEISNRHARVVRENAEALKLDSSKFQLRIQDAFLAIAQLAGNHETFDIILADPPFGEKNVGRRSTSLSQQLLDDQNLPGLLTSDGRLILGHSKRDQLTVPGCWQELKLLKHGDNYFRFLQLNRALNA